MKVSIAGSVWGREQGRGGKRLQRKRAGKEEERGVGGLSHGAHEGETNSQTDPQPVHSLMP